MATVFLMIFGMFGAVSGTVFAIVSGHGIFQVLTSYIVGGFVAGMAGLAIILGNHIISNIRCRRNSTVLERSYAAK